MLAFSRFEPGRLYGCSGRRDPLLTSVVALLLAAAVSTTPARATGTVDERIVDRSPLIVFGEVLSVRPGLEGAGGTTEYLFAVEEVMKGFVGGSVIAVRLPDGLRAERGAIAGTGQRMLAEGDRGLLFLEAEEAGGHTIVEYSPEPFRHASRFGHRTFDRVADLERAADPATASATSSCSGVTCLLQEGRFRTKAWYSTGGSSQAAGAVRAALGGSAGLFTSDSGSSELLVRVVNRCSATGYWAVYAGAASDAGFNVAIRDTRSNQLKWFGVEAGQSIADADAFPCASGDAGISTVGPGADPASRCSGATCLLQMGAFRMKSWYSRGGSSSRSAPAVAVNLGDSAGLFTSDGGHSELLVRVVNECGTTGYWTVHAGAASDADFRIAIRDTRSQQLEWFRVRTARTVADAEAFPCLGGDTSDRAALAALYEATSGPNWVDNTNWLTDEPLDEWYGVTTDESGNVVGLDLSGNFLVGKIPAGIGGLAHLQRLRLLGNALLQSRLPPEFFDLTELRHLDLSWTGLGGPIPPAIARLGNLEVLRWASSGLTGSIPPELGNLSNLRVVFLGYNYLTGEIPPSLRHLANLSNLEVPGNELTGPIPAELGRLSQLNALDLRANHLTGEIPAEIGDLTGLFFLGLSENELTGGIPGTLRSLSSLQRLDLGGNGFTGPIPSWFSTLRELRRLYLEDNALSGGLPEAIGALTRLTDLWVDGNPALSGPVPVSLTGLDNLENFKAGRTRLCAPQDPELLAWLGRIPSHRLARCELAEAYLTQSVQSREFPVPLVAGRPALLRVFVAHENAAGTRMPGVRARFYVDGAEVHRVTIPGGAGSIPAAVDEGSLTSSANADVPGSVIRPGLAMVIEIDPEGVLNPNLGIGRRVPKSGRMAVDVVELPDFQLTVIPFLYEFRPDRSILRITEEMAAAPEEHPLLAETRTLLPIGALKLNLHAPVLTSNDGGFAVLNETELIRLMEGRPGYHMGMMTPVRLGLLGVARLPGWSSFSQPLPRTVAHELGHNMGLFHAPCGGAAGPDPLYPHLTGVIGAWGYDRDARRLVSPYTPDLMTYCRNSWISDYHLGNALRHRVKSEGVGTAGAGTRFGQVGAAGPRGVRRRSLLVWGGLDVAGSPFLEPAFIADALPSLPPSGSRVRIEGNDGRRQRGVLPDIRHAGTAGPGRRAIRLRLCHPGRLGGGAGANQSVWRRRIGRPQPGHRPAAVHPARSGDRTGSGHPAPTGDRGARCRW